MKYRTLICPYSFPYFDFRLMDGDYSYVHWLISSSVYPTLNIPMIVLFVTIFTFICILMSIVAWPPLYPSKFGCSDGISGGIVTKFRHKCDHCGGIPSQFVTDSITRCRSKSPPHLTGSWTWQIWRHFSSQIKISITNIITNFF